METNYQITCKDWKTNDYPLHYEFRYQTEANDLAKLNTLPDEQEVTTLWYYGLEHTTPFSFLPLGYEATNYTLPIYIQVKNKYGSYANYGPLNVTVSEAIATVPSFLTCNSVNIILKVSNCFFLLPQLPLLRQ